MGNVIQVQSKFYESEFCNKVDITGSIRDDWYTCDKCEFGSNLKDRLSVSDSCEDVFKANSSCREDGRTIFWKKHEPQVVENKVPSESNPHPHIEKMREYIEDMSKDASIIWQSRLLPNEWKDLTCSPSWFSDHEYRRKPTEIDVNVLVKIKGEEIIFSAGPTLKHNLSMKFKDGVLISAVML